MAGTIYAGTYTTTILLDNPIQQSPATLTGAISVAGINPATDSGFYGVAAYAFAIENLGRITATGATSYGILLLGGGTITNGSAGSTLGTIQSEETGILLTGTLASTVSNFGTITATYGRGVFLQDGGTLANGASNATSADISGGFMGVAIYNAGGVLTNAGTIADTGTAGLGAALYAGHVRNLSTGTITGAYGVGFVAHADANSTLTNQGLIIGTTRDAAELTDGGTVTNSGTMAGAVAGVLALYGGATVHNTGLVEGQYAGIDLLAGGDLVNHAGATVSGGFGISFGNGTSAGALGTLNNAGLIRGETYQGVSMNAGGNAENSGSIYGRDAGFAGFYQPATLINSGTLESGTAGSAADFGAGGTLLNQLGGYLRGAYGIIFTDGSAGQTLSNTASLSNSGLIIATSGDGVEVRTGFSVTNAAGGTLSGGRYGVYLQAETGTLTNAGLIEGAIGLYGREVVASGSLIAPSLTILDSGTIIGTAGTALSLYHSRDVLIVDPGAVFSGGVIGGGASLVLQAGGIGTLGTLGLGMAGFSQVTLASGADWTGSGTIAAGAIFTDSGTLTLAETQFQLSGSLNGDGTIALGTGATLTMGGTAASSDTILFSQTGATLALTDPLADAAPIADFAAGDTLWLPQIPDQGLSEAFANGTLTILEQGSAVARLTLKGSYSSSDFALLADPQGGTDLVIPCFARGTRLATESGSVAVEDLRPGIWLRTWSGGVRGIGWIARRRVRSPRHRPVRIAAHAFGPGQPERTLLLSPDHAIYLDGVLVPAGRLADGGAITRPKFPDIDYWHVELDQHDVVLAEGLAVESYLDTGNRDQFDQEFGTRGGPGRRCAPLILGGATLARLRRSRLRPPPTPTGQGWVWLRTDDGLLAPARADARQAAFLLPDNLREATMLPASPCRVAVLLDGRLVAAEAAHATPWRVTLPPGPHRRCLELFRHGG